MRFPDTIQQGDVDRTVTRLPASPRRKSVKLPFNLLQTSRTDIHLFRDLVYNYDRVDMPNKSYSQVICQQAIRQNIPPNVHHLNQFERLNVILQIPELGVVAVGSQAGRVGLLTTTRWELQKQSGFKVEYILPFRSQEEKGVRPNKPLMGIAMGPVQGHETRPDAGSTLEVSEGGAPRPRFTKDSSRRFRLLMVYRDHTILSYEISRPAEGDNILVV